MTMSADPEFRNFVLLLKEIERKTQQCQFKQLQIFQICQLQCGQIISIHQMCQLVLFLVNAEMGLQLMKSLGLGFRSHVLLLKWIGEEEARIFSLSLIVIIQRSAKRWGCLLSYSQAEPGRELTQPSPRLLAEPCRYILLEVT